MVNPTLIVEDNQMNMSASIARTFTAMAIGTILITSPVLATNWEILERQSQSEKQRVLRAGITSAGYPCPNVTAVFFKGEDKDRAGYWAVSCTNGENYMVQIPNEDGGMMRTTPCSILERVGVKCWEKF